jgi:hypothetical protein
MVPVGGWLTVLFAGTTCHMTLSTVSLLNRVVVTVPGSAPKRSPTRRSGRRAGPDTVRPQRSEGGDRAACAVLGTHASCSGIGLGSGLVQPLPLAVLDSVWRRRRFGPRPRIPHRPRLGRTRRAAGGVAPLAGARGSLRAVAYYERSTRSTTLDGLPDSIRAAVRTRAEASQITVAPDAPAFLTRSRRLHKPSLFERLTGTADKDKEHLTAIVLGANDVLVATYRERRGTVVLAARLGDIEVGSTADRLAADIGGGAHDRPRVVLRRPRPSRRPASAPRSRAPFAARRPERDRPHSPSQ